MTEIKLNKSELAVLIVLNSDDYYLWTFSLVADEVDLTDLQSKRAVRSLARKGLAELTPAFSYDDGMLSGSGYRCSEKGTEFLKLKKGTEK